MERSQTQLCRLNTSTLSCWICLPFLSNVRLWLIKALSSGRILNMSHPQKFVQLQHACYGSYRGTKDDFNHPLTTYTNLLKT